MRTTSKAVLVFIKGCIAPAGYSPSFREIREGVGLTSISVASYHIDRLAEQGYITRVKGQARTIRITEAAKE